MAACGEVRPMDVMESSKKRCHAKDEQETSIDFGKRPSSESVMPQKEKVYKPKLVAVEALNGERKRFAAAAAAVGREVHQFQTEKMDKAAEKMDKIELGQETAVDNTQTEKKMDSHPESDPPAVVNGKHRLPDDYVTLILGMPVETPVDIDNADLSFITHRAKLLNRSDDWNWIEEQKQQYRERAALSKRITDQFLEFQARILDEWTNKGYVETDEDYEANLAATQEYSSQLWREFNPGLV